MIKAANAARREALAPRPSAAATPAPAAGTIVVTTGKEASAAVVRLVEMSTEQAERLVEEATEDANRILEVLNSQAGATRQLVRNTGEVFSALSERQGQLTGLLEAKPCRDARAGTLVKSAIALCTARRDGGTGQRPDFPARFSCQAL